MSVRVAKDVRGFHRLRQTACSSRTLNLIELAESAVRANQDGGVAPSAIEQLFQSNALNLTILLKHNVRAHERELFGRNIKVATKIFIPFDPKRLDVGGRSFFVEETLYKERLKELLNLDTGLGDAAVRHDMRILDSLSNCPTLDPFIIVERLRADGIVVKPNLLTENYATTLKASADVFKIFEPLVERALGKSASRSEVSRFVEQVWNVNANSNSNPFFEALRIPRADWPAVIFAWKALIYYDLTTKESPQRLHRVLGVLKAVEPKQRVSYGKMRELNLLKRDFGRKLYALHHGAAGYIRDMLQRIINAVLSENDATSVSASLQDLAQNIAAIGTDVVLFDQVTSYFLFLFGKSASRLDIEELELELNNFCEIVDLRTEGLGAPQTVPGEAVAAATA